MSSEIPEVKRETTEEVVEEQKSVTTFESDVTNTDGYTFGGFVK